MASSPHTSTGPPFERLYAVEPDGVEQIRPSQGSDPRSSPPIDQPSSIIRPSDELVTTTSLTAVQRSPPDSPSSTGSSTTWYSPAKARAIPSSSASASNAARKPTRPKFAPITGTPLPRKRRSARSIVPSPPSTTARSAPANSPSSVPSPCFSRSSSGYSSSTPRSAAIRCSCSRAAPIVSGLPCVTTAARLTSGHCFVELALDHIGIHRPLAVYEVQKEL